MKNKVNENLGGEQATLASTTPIGLYSKSDFHKEIKDYFKKQKGTKLARIETAGADSEIQDIDIVMDLTDSGDLHTEDNRAQAKALVHQAKQDFHNYLLSKGYNIATMSVRGVRTEGDKALTTISLTLSSVPMMRTESKETRVANLIESTIREVVGEGELKITNTQRVTGGSNPTIRYIFSDGHTIETKADGYGAANEDDKYTSLIRKEL